MVRTWPNQPAPGGRGRRLDLVIGEPDPSTGGWDIRRLRVGIENKSVITAHRNATSRYDDLDETLRAVHAVRPEAVMIATVLVGTADRVLNVPDRIKPFVDHEAFERDVRSRLSTGDQELWVQHRHAVSKNRKLDTRNSIELFRKLRTRPPAHTHVQGYDFLSIVPVFVDNVARPCVVRENEFGIDVDAEYVSMLETICRGYRARWHL